MSDPADKDEFQRFAESLVPVGSPAEAAGLPLETEAVIAWRPDDALLAALSMRVPGLRHLMADGNSRVTDAGLEHLGALTRLESLDLEWSGVTDAGLPLLASVQSLRWVDLEFCAGITPEGLTWLRRERPDLEVLPRVG